MQNLVSAHTVSTETFGTYIFEKTSLYIRLYRIMHLYVILCGKVCNMVYRLAEQVHVVVIEWGRNFVETLYCIEI